MPTYVHTLIGIRPPVREDEPWISARIEGATTIGGSMTAIETVTLSPVDADPLAPAARTLTTDLAPFAEGYLRVVFIDAGLQESPPSEPVQSPAPGSTGDLTTLAAVRRLLQAPDSEHGQDGLLQDMITEASVMLQRELGRQFSAEANVTKTIAYFGNGYLNLAPYDLRSITAVTKDADGTDPVTLEAGGWLLRGGTGDATYRSVTLTGYGNDRLTPFEQQTVTITGDWGFEQVPADVERGVKITVKTWLREGATFTPDGDVIRFERVGRIPQDVLDGLAHYRMPVVG